MSAVLVTAGSNRFAVSKSSAINHLGPIRCTLSSMVKVSFPPYTQATPEIQWPHKTGRAWRVALMAFARIPALKVKVVDGRPTRPDSMECQLVRETHPARPFLNTPRLLRCGWSARLDSLQERMQCLLYAKNEVGLPTVRCTRTIPQRNRPPKDRQTRHGLHGCESFSRIWL